MSAAPPQEEATRCGFVALIGAPNAGKSTLLNALVGQKVSIVSRKAQTTRALVRAIAVEGSAQIIFVDTPGIFVPKRRLDRAMVTSAWSGAGDADVVAFLVDARKGLDDEAAAILDRLAGEPRRKLLLLNKIDALGDKSALIPLSAKLNERLAFEETFMISALTGDGIAELRRAFASRMPPGPWHYPEDQLSDMPMRMMAAEITREKIYDRLHEELALSLDGRDDLVGGGARRARCASSRPSMWSAKASARSCSARAGRRSRRSARRRAASSRRSSRRESTCSYS